MRLTLILLAVCFSVPGFSQLDFSIKGKYNNPYQPVDKVFINYRAGGVTVTDSAMLKDGEYNLKGELSEPVLAQIFAKPVSAGSGKRPAMKDVATIFLSAGNITVTSTDSFSNVIVTGSAANDEFAKINERLKPFNEKMAQLNQQYTALAQQDETGKAKLVEEAKTLSKEMKIVFKNYVNENPSSPVAMYALSQYAGYDINADEVDPLFSKLDGAVKSYPSYKEMEELLVVARKLSVGKPAIEFTQNDTLGKPVSLSSFRGKYVLVDFWASWCGPCRRENPNVVSAFNTYKDKGFTVLGVSLDQPGAKDRWLKAIHDDKLTWTHVSDLKFWENEVAKMYGIRSIPFNLLLDKEGKIVARNVTGADLHKKLAEIFN